MDREIKKFVEYILDIKTTEEYQFCECCGFTFVFKKEFTYINSQNSSAEIKPIAIIYEENGEYFLAPLDVVDQIDEVVKEFVKQQLQ